VEVNLEQGRVMVEEARMKNKARDFVKGHMPKGRSLSWAAAQLKVPSSTWRQWLNRQKMPETAFDKVATLLGISTGELKEAGFKVARPQARHPAMGNVLPLIRCIAEAGFEQVSEDELRHLVRLVPKLSNFSPELVKELVNLYRNQI
jgi:hypothetical protein